jgi:hypothetical protein
LVARVFSEFESQTLVSINTRCLKEVCTYISLPFSYQICSSLDLDFPKNMGAGDWAPHISHFLGASTYVNPVGGKNLFHASDFSDRGIGLKFLKPPKFHYPVSRHDYEGELSILDCLMWNSPETVLKALQDNSEFDEN